MGTGTGKSESGALSYAAGTRSFQVRAGTSPLAAQGTGRLDAPLVKGAKDDEKPSPEEQLLARVVIPPSPPSPGKTDELASPGR